MHCNWTRPKAIASARPSDVQKVDRTISYLLYIALMAQQSDAGLKMTDLFTARALLVLEQAPVACIANLENDVVSAGLIGPMLCFRSSKRCLPQPYPRVG